MLSASCIRGRSSSFKVSSWEQLKAAPYGAHWWTWSAPPLPPLGLQSQVVSQETRWKQEPSPGILLQLRPMWCLCSFSLHSLRKENHCKSTWKEKAKPELPFPPTALPMDRSPAQCLQHTSLTAPTPESSIWRHGNGLHLCWQSSWHLSHE